MTLLLQIITPEKEIFKEEVNEVIIPTVDGEITILPNHIDLLTKIKPGEITIKKSGKSEILAITGGFLEVNKNTVSILAEYAVRAENIEVAKAQAAEERAKKVMKEREGEKEFMVAEADLRKAILELKVARKHKTQSSIKPQ